MTVYNNLGRANESRGDFKKALKFFKLALSTAKETENKDAEGSTYNNLGRACNSLCDFNEAINSLQLGLRIAEDTKNKTLEGTIYTNLGAAYHSLGHFEKAIEFHLHGSSIAKQNGNKDTEGTGYNNLGSTYHSLGDFKKAIMYCRDSLRIAEESGNKNLEGGAYSNLGRAYSSVGDLKKGIEFYQASFIIAKETGNTNLQGIIYANLGTAYESLGDFERAIESYKESLKIAETTGNKNLKGTAGNNLGTAYYCQNKFGLAHDRWNDGLCIARKTGNKHLEGTVYNNLGLAKYCVGSFNEAKEHFEEGLSIAKETGNKDSESKTYINFGRVSQSLNDFKTAVEFYQLALSIARETGNKHSEQVAFSTLAHAFWSQGDLDEAEEFFKSSIKLFEEMRVLLQMKDEWKISFRNKLDCSQCLMKLQIQRGNILDALSTAEKGRAQALMDLMELQYATNARNSTQTASKQQMEPPISSVVSTTLFFAKDTETMNFWLLREGQLCHFEQQKFSENQMKTLTENTYYQIDGERSVGSDEDSQDESDDEDEMKDLFHRGEEPAASPQDEERCLKTLYDLIIAPISHLIKDDELIIVPDGSSFLIPYAALMDQGSRYLSQTRRIRLAPSLQSLRLLTKCPEGHHSTTGALLVGNPWVETVRIKTKKTMKPFPQLPGAEKEVQMIGQILNIQPLIGKNATKENVLRKISKVSLVHIAAHGLRLTGEIVLSPNLASSDRPEEKDFLLTMADVLDAHLSAKLVVLSCCYSGRGRIKAEGMVGIARAFLGSGARSVIASLWNIDDLATLEFMRHFYEHLVAGQSASKSLHSAMKWMRKSEKFNKVKHWAPFVLIGDDVTLNFGQ